MESKQTVSLHACLVSRILVHDCVFACLLFARSHLGHLRHSCSPLVFTMSHQSSWWSTSSSWEQREPQWNRAAADGDQSWDRSWTPTKRTSKYEQHDWQSPAGFKTTQGLPDNFVQSKSHLDSREIYGKNFVTEDCCNFVEFQVWTGWTKHGTSEARRPIMAWLAQPAFESSLAR